MNKRRRPLLFVLMLALQIMILSSLPAQAATKLSTPVLTKVVNGDGYQKVSWQPTVGASYYKVYMKVNGSGSWKYLGTSTSTAYINRSLLKSGVSNTYTVRAYDGSESSWYNTKGKSCTYLSTPVPTGILNGTGYQRVSWKPVPGAKYYKIYGIVNGKGSWKYLGTSTTNSFAFKNGIKSGTTYRYTVLASNGVAPSFYKKQGIEKKYLSVPSMTDLSNGSGYQKLTWNKVTGAEYYKVYQLKSGKWVCLAQIAGTSYINRNVSQTGAAYCYTVRAFAKNTYSSYNSKGKSLTYRTILENPTYQQKCMQIFGKTDINTWYPGGYYANQNVAEKNIVTIKVKTWDFISGKSGAKKTVEWSLQVHKNLAPTVQKAFSEIYNGKEKFPIHAISGYRREYYGHSEHRIGTAIDINPVENYMVNTQTGVISCGSYWRPGKDPYSIPKNGEVARILGKYGFSQGDWGASKDYMHFSYFGT